MPAKGLASTSISGSDSEKKLNSFLTIVQTQKCDCDTYPMYTLVQTHKCACDTYPMYNLTINIKITTNLTFPVFILVKAALKRFIISDIYLVIFLLL